MLVSALAWRAESDSAAGGASLLSVVNGVPIPVPKGARRLGNSALDIGIGQRVYAPFLVVCGNWRAMVV